MLPGTGPSKINSLFRVFAFASASRPSNRLKNATYLCRLTRVCMIKPSADTQSHLLNPTKTRDQPHSQERKIPNTIACLATLNARNLNIYV